jgi:transcriptional regulator with XRE-family HTH domain
VPLRSRQPPPPPQPPAASPTEVDLNQVVAYNVRAARELRGWTQEEFAVRLEPYLGQRLTQASVSGIERAFDGERRREFDAQELLVFAQVFDLPILWFLLPPPGDHRIMRGTTRPVDELYAHLLGMPHQLEPLYARLREVGVTNPDATDNVLKLLTGGDTSAHQWSYRERRKELLLALLDQHADEFDGAVEDLGRIVDRLRQVGIRGFLAETTNDRDLGRAGSTADEPASASTGGHETVTKSTSAAKGRRAGPGSAPDQPASADSPSRVRRGKPREHS